MAIAPSSVYPGQVDTSDPSGYPYGTARNDVVVGDGSGTPLEELWVKDIFGFQQALLAAAGITPSNVPDKVGASQYLTALLQLSQATSDARAKLALLKTQALNWKLFSTGTVAPANTLLSLAGIPNMGGTTGAVLCLYDGGGSIYRSVDGGNFWLQQATLPFASTKPELAAGLLDGTPIFFANGTTANHFYTSLDGTSWTDRNVVGGPTGNGTPRYVATANRWIAERGSSGMFYAPATSAGITSAWIASTVPSGWTSSAGGSKRVEVNENTIVVLPLNSYNKFLVSTDAGLNYSERTVGTNQGWTGLAYSAAEGLWMATSDGGTIVTSPDALTWSVIGSPANAVSSDLAAKNNLWVVTTKNGAYGGLAFSTDRGLNWRNVTFGNHTVATQGWKRLVCVDDRFICAHSDGSNIEIAMSLRSP